MTDVKDILGRPGLRDKHDPVEFRRVYDGADFEDQERLRTYLRNVESGRFHAFLDAAHNLLARSDGTRRRAFEEHQSNHIFEWVKTFGAVEGLHRFPDLGE